MCRTRKWLMILPIYSIVLFSMIGCDNGVVNTTTKSNGGIATNSIQNFCSSLHATDKPVGYWPLDTHGFQGIFQFLGQTNPKNVDHPNIAGADLEWSWAKVEPSEGNYNWRLVDKDISIWTSHGKPVILRFATGGQKIWSGTVNGSYTPSWLFDKYGVPRVVETNGTVFPLYWHQTYLQKLAAFVNAVAARYDNNPYVVAVQIGVGQGGETEPDGIASNNSHQLQLWQEYGYSNALWWQTLQKIVKIYENAWHHTPLVLMVTSTFLQYQDKIYSRSLIEQYAVNEGIWLQINSLNDTMSAHIMNGKDHFTTNIQEQKQSARDSGYPAMNDVQQGMKLGARYVLIFAVDIDNLNNNMAFSYAAQRIVAPEMSDCSGHNLTLSVTGRVAPVPGVSGRPDMLFAQFFDGSTGTASIAKAPITSTTAWTLAAWLYPTVLPQSEALVIMNGANGTGGGGFGFGIASGSSGGTGSRLVAYFPGIGWIDSGYTFTTIRQWYHVVVTYKDSAVNFYVNDQSVSHVHIHKAKAVPAHFSLGSGYDLGAGVANHFFTGAVDDVVVYEKNLSPSQIASIS